MSISGNLRTMLFADLLQGASQSRKTGTLVLEGKPFPQVRAVTKGDNHIEVSWDGTGKAKLWKAESPNRDFRGSEWSSEELEGDNFCTCMVEAPEDGWVATFVSVTFPPPVSGAQPFNLSTPITIAPEIFPHDGATK